MPTAGFRRYQNAPWTAGAFVLTEQTTPPIEDNDGGLWRDATSLRTQLLGKAGAPAILRGLVPSARLPFAVDPANLDTFTVGGHEFRFLTTLLAAQAYTQVKRGAGAAASLARAVDALNGTTNANVVQATTPFSQSVVADAVTATSLRLRLADARGGTATQGTAPSIALAASITAGATAWSVGNLNETGKPVTEQEVSWFLLAITVAMVAEGVVYLELPFEPAAVNFQAYAGGLPVDTADVVAISGSTITVTLVGGAGSYTNNLGEGDTLFVEAFK